MTYLDAHTKWQLEQEGLEDLSSRLDWAVQSDPSLEGAGVEEVRKYALLCCPYLWLILLTMLRRRFRHWLKQNPSQSLISTLRYHACVMVDDYDVEWVVRKRPVPPDQHQGNEILSVTLVSKDYEGHRDPSMESDYDSSDDEDESDEFDPIPMDQRQK